MQDLTTHFAVVTDVCTPDGETDVSDALETFIGEHPNETIFFPKGTYLLSRPLCTSANPKHSVQLLLDNYAILRADPEHWAGGAVVSLGGAEPFNNVTDIGANYGIRGGIIDCSGVADGVEIASGRNTNVRDVSIKRSVIGVHILHGANNGSADANVNDVDIIGNDAENSVGVQIEACDNQIGNVRIGHVTVGVYLKAGGNTLTNVHPLFAMASGQYDKSIGFYDYNGDNFYYYCYSDQFRVGFCFGSECPSSLFNCWSWWWTGAGKEEYVMASEKKFNALVTNHKVGFSEGTKNVVLDEGEAGGVGFFSDIIGRKSRFPAEDAYEKHLRGIVFG